MSDARTTIMILMPGRNALSFAAPRAPARAVIGALLVPMLTGAVAEHCYRTLRSPAIVAAAASLSRVEVVSAPARSEVTQRPSAATPRPSEAPAASPSENDHLDTDTAKPATGSMMLAATTPNPGAVIAVQTMLRTIAGHHKGGPTDAELAQVPGNGYLRLQALHLSEELNVRPFDDLMRPIPDALAQVDHALRCRVTGTEIAIDRGLIAILVRLHTLYGKTIQLVSGHRQPATLGTKKTSQHALGRAADIRIPGVGIEELKRVAIKFGARGVGLYPEKGFVHVDVRQKPLYRWIYTEALGEQADMGMAIARPQRQPSTDADARNPDSEEDEADDDGAHRAPAPVHHTVKRLDVEPPPAELKAEPAEAPAAPTESPLE